MSEGTKSTDKKSFYEWLMIQDGVDDPVGDLAADVRQDCGGPPQDAPLHQWMAYLSTRGTSSDFHKALEDAIIRYTRYRYLSVPDCALSVRTRVTLEIAWVKDGEPSCPTHEQVEEELDDMLARVQDAGMLNSETLGVVDSLGISIERLPWPV